MADSPETTKNISLVLKEIVKNQNSIVKELGSIVKQTKKAQDVINKLIGTFSKVDDAETNSAKQNKKLAKTIDEITDAYKNLGKETKDLEKDLDKTINLKAQRKKVADGLATSLKTTYSAIKITAAAFSGLAIKAFNDSGSALLNFAKTSIDGSKSIDRLTTSYQRLGGSLGDANISLLNSAKTLGEFQSKGLAEAFASMAPEVSDGILEIKNTLLEAFPEEEASNIMKSFQDAFGDQFDTMLNVAKSFGADMQKIMSSIGSGDMAKAQKQIEKLRKTLSKQVSFGIADPKQLQPLFTALDILNDKASGKKTSLEAITSWNNLVNVVKKYLDDLSSDFYKTFGTDLANGINKAKDYIKNLMSEFKKFKDSGGLDEYINRLKAGFQWLLDNGEKIIGTISSALKTAYDWFQRIVSGNSDWKDKAIGVGVAYAFLPGVSSAINGIVGLIAGASLGMLGWTKSIGTISSTFGKLWTSLKFGSGLVKGLGVSLAAFAGYEVGSALASGLAKAFGASEELQTSLGRVGSIAGAMAGGFAVGGPIGAGIAGLVAATKVFADMWQESSKRIQEANSHIDETSSKLKDQIALQAASDPSANLKSKIVSLNSEIEKTGVELENSWWPKWMQKDRIDHIEKLQEEIRKTQGQIADKSLDTAIDARIQKTGGMPTEEYEKVNALSKQNIDLISQINKGTEDERKTIQRKIEDINKEIDVTKQLGAEKINIEKINNRIAYVQGKLSNTKDINEQSEGLSELNRLQDLLIKGKEKLLTIRGSFATEEDNEKQLKKLSEAYKELSIEKQKIQNGSDAKGTEEWNKKLEETNKNLEEVKKRLDMSKASDSLKKLAKDADIAKNATQELGKSALSERAEFEALVASMKSYAVRADTAASVSNLLADSIGAMGPNFELAGRSADNMIKSFSDDTINQSIEGIVKNLEAINIAKAKEAELNEKIKEAHDTKNSEKENELIKERASYLIGTKDLYDLINKSVKANAAASERIVAKERESAKMAEIVKNLRQEDLRISQALYGTPALAVQAQLKITEAMEQQKQSLIGASNKQKQFIEDQKAKLAAVKEEIALAESRGDAGKEVEEAKQKQNLLEGTIWSAQKNQLQTQTEIKRITSEQLETVKQLRDGYLDAVQAQAFSAGRFEKIIVTREKNASMALEKNMAKRNFLLGQIKKDAMAFDAEAYQFSAGGLGALQKPGGGAVSQEDIVKRAQQASQNIADPIQKAATEEAQKLALGIYQQANDVQKEIATTYSTSADLQVKAINNNTDALNAYSSEAYKKTATGVALKDNEVVAGEAANQAVKNTPINVVGVTSKGNLSRDSKVNNSSAAEQVKQINNTKTTMPKLEAINIPKQVKQQIEDIQTSGLNIDEHGFASALVGEKSTKDSSNMEKARIANARIYEKSQSGKQINKIQNEISQGMRKHYEGLNKLQEKDLKKSNEDPVERMLKAWPIYKGTTINSSGEQVQVTKQKESTEKEIPKNKATVSNKTISANDSWSGKFQTVAKILTDAGVIIDELIAEEHGVTNSRHAAVRGGQSITNNG